MTSPEHAIPQQHISYSEVKPLVQFARQRWSNLETDQPFVSFLDKHPNKSVQLKATRRQVVDYGVFYMERGDSSREALQRVKNLVDNITPQH